MEGVKILNSKIVRRLVFNFEQLNTPYELPQPTVERVEFSTVERDGKTGNFLRVLDQSPFGKPVLTAQFA